jgi:hypothetical protein
VKPGFEIEVDKMDLKLRVDKIVEGLLRGILHYLHGDY